MGEFVLSKAYVKLRRSVHFTEESFKVETELDFYQSENK